MIISQDRTPHFFDPLIVKAKIKIFVEVEIDPITTGSFLSQRCKFDFIDYLSFSSRVGARHAAPKRFIKQNYHKIAKIFVYS